MAILQQTNNELTEDNLIETETTEEQQARLKRLRAAEIKRELKHIDTQRIRPLAAIVAGTATDYDHSKLSELESRAAVLRTELAEVQTDG